MNQSSWRIGSGAPYISLHNLRTLNFSVYRTCTSKCFCTVEESTAVVQDRSGQTGQDNTSIACQSPIAQTNYCTFSSMPLLPSTHTHNPHHPCPCPYPHLTTTHNPHTPGHSSQPLHSIVLSLFGTIQGRVAVWLLVPWLMADGSSWLHSSWLHLGLPHLGSWLMGSKSTFHCPHTCNRQIWSSSKTTCWAHPPPHPHIDHPYPLPMCRF